MIMTFLLMPGILSVTKKEYIITIPAIDFCSAMWYNSDKNGQKSCSEPNLT